MSSTNDENLHHHKRKMSGRDPQELHRVSTPLELLFDLTFATCFGLAASQSAHFLAIGHFRTGLLGFSFASFAICWAWVNFSWFASAYDTDDWVYRITTMVQMMGVLVLATGLPAMFAAMDQRPNLNNGIMVGGYVIMRVAMVFQWLRAAKEDPQRRSTCLTYAATIFIAQVGWILRTMLDLPLGISIFFLVVLVLVEFAGPYLAERKHVGTPWHAPHIVERNSLFVIIALGEGVVGSVAALSAVIEKTGWTMDVAFVGIAGMGLTFTLWWIYFLIPSAAILKIHRHRFIIWGYIQLLIVTSIVAIGAGLRVAAYFIEGNAQLTPLATVLCIAVPVGFFLGTIYALYYVLTKSFDRLHLLLLFLTVIVFAVVIAAANAGISMAACLVLLMLAPVVTVVGYETRGYRHNLQALQKLTRN